MVGNNFIGRQMSAIKPYFEKKKFKIYIWWYAKELSSGTPELQEESFDPWMNALKETFM